MIHNLLQDKVIAHSTFRRGDYMNNVFLREKRDSSPNDRKYRLILNMKKLNKQFVELIHHKIHSLQTCIDLMHQDCYMASIDLKNAFHTLPMDPKYTKYLKFKLGGLVYKYLVLPMGFRDSPRIFCKILKPVLAFLHRKGHISSVYIDDFYLQGRTFEECFNNVETTLELLKSLGFEISDKSSLQPSKTMIHLGFLLDSHQMRISLSEEKRERIRQLIQTALKAEFLNIKELATIIGTLVASFPAVEYGPLFYRQLELFKIHSLKMFKNYKKNVVLDNACKKELDWWLKEGLYCGNVISHGNPDYTIQTDSSSYAWGAILLNTLISTQGLWKEEEQNLHINALELKAVLLGVKALCTGMHHCHIQVQIDNQTAVTYINNMGGTHSRICNDIAFDLLRWCKNNNIWISACHIPGKSNVRADELSRKINDDIEWMLDTDIFQEICQILGKPEIDLFASRINHQLPKYISFLPDSEAFAIDAFSHKWDMFAYIFPPFNLIPRVLRKLQEDQTEKALVIVPKWQAAPWYPKLSIMQIQEPIHLKTSTSILTLPQKRTKTHPMLPKLKLMAFILSGKNIGGMDSVRN